MKQSEMKTTNIKGKEYVEVNQRIKFFRENYDNGKILTDIISIENGVCIMKATIFINDDIVATGHAYEKEGSTFINKTSYIENCETSAVGRALGIFGIGVDTSVASSEEVQNAIKQQGQKKHDTKTFGEVTEDEAKELAIKKGLVDVLKSLKKDDNVEFKPAVQKAMCEKYNVDKWGDIRFDDYQKFIEEVKQELQKQKDEKEVGF